MIRSLVRPAASVLAAAAVTAILLAIPASTPSQAASFTLSDPNCSSFTWDGNTNTLTCVTSGGGGGGAVTCSSISVSTGAPTVATAEVLTANCSGGVAALSYTWTLQSGAGCAGVTPKANPAQADVPAPGGSSALSCTYKVSATDGATNASANKTINYSTGGGGGGGGGGPIACSNVSGATHVVDATWSSNGTYLTANVGGFGPSDAIVVRFTTSIITSATGKGYIRAVEYSDPIAPRTGTISSQPCDFSAGIPVANGGGLGAAFANDTAPWLYFTLVNPKSGFATLQASTTYYFNMINAGCISGSGTCNMQIYFVKPSGS